MPTDASTSSLTVYYDGGCPLCRREIAAYRKLEGADNVAWLDVSGSCDLEVDPGLTRDAAMNKFHVRCANGTLKSGAAAFAELWKHLPALSWFGWCLGLPGVRHAADACYVIFLRLRPHLQRFMRG